MLFLESGGRKKGCAPFKSSKEWVVVSVTSLPNPQPKIKDGTLKDDLDDIREWISEREPEQWERVVKKCATLLNSGKNVRVQCIGGQHRSPCVMEAVARQWREENSHRSEAVLVTAHKDRKGPCEF